VYSGSNDNIFEYLSKKKKSLLVLMIIYLSTCKKNLLNLVFVFSFHTKMKAILDGTKLNSSKNRQ
jgi:hypothetical protein